MSPLSRDPDTLRIPAFMRKRSLAARGKRPLILTALDRKKAGIAPEGLQRKKKKASVKKPRVQTSKINFWGAGLLPKKSVKKRKMRAVRARKIPAIAEIETTAEETFAAPLIADFKANFENKSKQKTIGTITHYYDRIQVGVIKLAGALSVGDCITYETIDGQYEQIVESMEINREPVFKASRGKEIGLKLHKIPRIGCHVLK